MSDAPHAILTTPVRWFRAGRLKSAGSDISASPGAWDYAPNPGLEGGVYMEQLVNVCFSSHNPILLFLRLPSQRQHLGKECAQICFQNAGVQGPK
jgi:hypothetical protein